MKMMQGRTFVKIITANSCCDDRKLLSPRGQMTLQNVGAQCIAPAIQGVLVVADPSFRSKDAKQCFNLYEEQYYEE